MKVTHIELAPVHMEMEQGYTIAYESVSKTDNIFLCLETNTDLRGYGCAAPDFAVAHERAEETLHATQPIISSLLTGRDPLQRAAIVEALRQPLKDYPSARAMVDMALYDLLGKAAGLSLHYLLGGYRKYISTSITIGILDMDKTLTLARHYVEQGFSALKIKGGKDVELDIARVRALRKQLGAKIELRFDANQGYCANDALRFIEGIKKDNVKLLEQPTAKNDYDLLGRITRKAPIPIMADESMMGLKDVFKLAKGDLVDMVNIKLMKTGGISNAIQMNAVARAAGIEAMVGCMDESALAIAAGLHLALSSANITHADLDGHLGLKNDPAHGAVILKKGRLYPTGRPGLGFDPRIF